VAVLDTVDGRAVGIGALVAIAVALPAALVAQVVVDDADNSLSFVFFALVLFGFAAGGFAAARHAPHSPFSNGALAALAAFVVIQGLGAIRRAVVDDPVSLANVVFTGLLAYAAGLLGALVAAKQASR
jgi:putative membrane protein (TIGR04086 family)